MTSNHTNGIEQYVKVIEKGYYHVLWLSSTLVIVANFLVVVSSVILVRKGQQPKCMYLLLGNISLSDLIIGIMAMIGVFHHSGYNDDNILFCVLVLGTYVICTISSVSSILLIAIDRYLYIVHGLKYKTLLYPKKMKYMILGTWILGILLGLAPLFIWRRRLNEAGTCWYIIVAKPLLIIVTSLYGIFLVFIVIILYSSILYVAVGKVMQIQRMMLGKTNNINNDDDNKIRFFKGTYSMMTPDGPQSSESSSSAEKVSVGHPNKFNRIVKTNSDESVIPNKWKAIKVVLFVTGTFAVTWIPYLVTSIISGVCDIQFEFDPAQCERFRIFVVAPAAVLAYINSFLNPIIYAWWHTGFRTAFIKMLLKKI